MWASNKSAKKAANGTHLAIRIGNLQFDEDSDETARAKITINALAGIGLDAIGPDVYIGLMPDQGTRARHQSAVVVELTSSVPPRLVGVLAKDLSMARSSRRGASLRASFSYPERPHSLGWNTRPAF